MSSPYARDAREGALRQEIVRIGQMMYEREYLCGFEGNLSVRLGDNRILITPSGLHKGLLRPEQLLIVDNEGQVIGYQTEARRGLRPTSELPMHLEAYRQRPDVIAVVHAHPPITVALSIAGIPMNTPLLPEVIVLLGMVPTAPYSMSSSTEGADAIRELIRHNDAVILERHGTITVGTSLTQAFMRLETVEQNARIHFMLAQLGQGGPLGGHELVKLLKMRRKMGLEREGDAAQFRRLWGVSPDDPG